MNFVRHPRREVTAFLGVAYTLALAIALFLPHAQINLLLSVAVPTLTVVVLTFTITPRGRRRAVWRGIGLGRAGFRAWPAAIGLPVLLCGGAYGAAVLVGAGRLDVHLSDLTPINLASLASSLVFGTVIILGEEIGWRGYLLPRTQELTGSRRRGAVFTGFAHGCFHLPLILLATTYDMQVPRWVAAPMAVLVITAGGVFYAWIRDISGSVWAVAVAHNTVNTVFDLGAAAVVATSGSSLGYVAGETGVATLAVVVLTALVLLRYARVWREPAPGESPSAGEPPRTASAA
jgi:uncharacterized protein